MKDLTQFDYNQIIRRGQLLSPTEQAKIALKPAVHRSTDEDEITSMRVENGSLILRGKICTMKVKIADLRKIIV